jgi:DNA-binding MurR/RpiR family transcriptional regulator
LATVWAYYLRTLGLQSTPISANAGGAALLLRDAQPDDLIFAVSLGLDPEIELGNLLRQAQANDLTTVSVTTSPTLLPARHSTLNLSLPAKTPSGYPSFDTLMGALSLIWQALISLNEERSAAGVKRMTDALASLADEKYDVATYDISAVMRLWNQE